jgi:hypothetical protein
MTKIEAQIPDYLAKQALAAAERENVPIDQIVALALSAQLAVWRGADDIQTRARRANLTRFDRVMAKVPDAPPLERGRVGLTSPGPQPHQGRCNPGATPVEDRKASGITLALLRDCSRIGLNQVRQR